MPAPPAPVVPVALALDGVLGDEVASYVESELAWQIVVGDGPPRPLLRLVAGDAAGLVVVELGMSASPNGPEVVDVLAWPENRHRLSALAQAVGRRGSEPGPPLLHLAGGAGGVGTSTVALAVAGLLAWSSHRVLVVGGEGLCRLCGLAPWHGPGAPEIAALGPGEVGAEVELLARAVRGVPGLRALGGGPIAEAPGWPVDVIVADADDADDADDAEVDARAPDLVVAAADERLASLAASTTPVLLNGCGPLTDDEAAHELGRPAAGRLPRSRRVARAGAHGRVPAGLPGAWLDVLSGALRALDGPSR